MAGLLTRPGNWQVAACDIGQGDAMVVRSGGQVALIDTGADPGLLTACLETLAIGRIDLLILTHYDLDHVGGAEAVVGLVDRVLVGPPGEPDDERLAQRFADHGALVHSASRGDNGSFGELSYTILWPPARLGDFEPGNDASVVAHFTPAADCADGCLSSVFLGDLGETAQTRLLAVNRSLGRVDLVKVSHHGSADQSSALYQRLGATVGLIGVGAGNDYGHPTPQLLDMLAASGTAVTRTDQDGLILVAPAGTDGGLTVWRETTGVGADD
ncbi:ComEC/Rec2 family competence protein [Glaciihabitans tibetensis]|uniref:ComEC/Rec2 family competence protein n=1 Tax=Glaciihabitans tibetensis TaxID=1266600 RepID=UPI0024819A35|nr:MBL fold metallo-hydrolase [Glaciihabitans tibetensis]